MSAAKKNGICKISKYLPETFAKQLTMKITERLCVCILVTLHQHFDEMCWTMKQAFSV